MVNGARSIPGYTHSNHYFVCLFVFQHGLPDEEKENVKTTGCFSWLKCFFTQVSCRSAEKYECKISFPQESLKGFSWGGYGFADRFMILTYLCPIIQQQTIYGRILPKFHPQSAFWVIFPKINRFSFPQPQRFELPSLMGFAL